jgi:hypothetical protein
MGSGLFALRSIITIIFFFSSNYHPQRLLHLRITTFLLCVSKTENLRHLHLLYANTLGKRSIVKSIMDISFDPLCFAATVTGIICTIVSLCLDRAQRMRRSRDAVSWASIFTSVLA